MKISMITIREVPEEQYPQYIDALQRSGLPIDGGVLWRTGRSEIVSIDNGSPVKTTVRLWRGPEE